MVDPASSEFRVDVKATGHSFAVLLNEYTAKIDVSSGGSLEKADFSFASHALDSNSAKRDKKMRKWLESDTVPTIHFRLKSVDKEGTSLVGLGDLTLHGITKPVVVPFSIEKAGDKVTINGTATVDHQDYGLEVITMLFFKVDPELKVSFTLVGKVEE